MRNMKNRISFLLVMVMLFALLAVPANAVEVKDSKAIVTDAEVEAAIAAANSDTVTIDFSGVGEVVTGVEISAVSVSKLADTGKTLTVATGIASLEVNQAALNGMAAQVGDTGTVALAIGLMPMAGLTPAQLAAVANAKVWFETSIMYGNQHLEVAEGGSITVLLPEALVGAMGGDNFTVALLDAEGKFHEIKTESKGGFMVAQLNELAVYALVEKSMFPEEPAAPVNPFEDVAETDWYFNPVMWAVNAGVTGGKTATTFAPNEFCTRAQVVTFLYAAAGKPEIKVTVNPFDDVSETDWFYKPVMWAVENGITGGKTATTFAPNEICTRAQVVTFLYAAEDKPAVEGKSTFTDVADADWFAKPVIWAKTNQITGGISDTEFGPNNNCTRAQVVTFLYAAEGKPAIK